MHTSPAQTETVAAARTLVQWARTYQTRWQPDAPAWRSADGEPEESDGLGNTVHALDGHLDPAEDDCCHTPVADSVRAVASVPVAPVEPVGPPPSVPSAPLPPAAIEPPASAPVAQSVTALPKAKRRSASWVWVAASAAVVVITLAVAAGVLLMRTIAAAPPEPTTGLMSLESSPAGATAFIDGVEAGQTPLVKEVPVGNHIVEFRRGKNARTLQLAVAGGTKVTGLVDWNKKPTGRLVIESSASDTTVLVDRKKRGVAPLTIDDLPVGRHTVTLQSLLGSVSRTVTIADGKTVTVSEELAPGLLKVTAPPGVRVFEGRDIIPLNDQRQALLPSGTHALRFVDNVTGASERRTVTIEPNEITEVSVAPTAAASAPETTSPPKAGTGEGP